MDISSLLFIFPLLVLVFLFFYYYNACIPLFIFLITSQELSQWLGLRLFWHIVKPFPEMLHHSHQRCTSVSPLHGQGRLWLGVLRVCEYWLCAGCLRVPTRLHQTRHMAAKPSSPLESASSSPLLFSLHSLIASWEVPGIFLHILVFLLRTKMALIIRRSWGLLLATRSVWQWLQRGCHSVSGCAGFLAILALHRGARCPCSFSCK